MTLGDLIKEYRKKNNLSMADFAEKSKISKAYISLLEKNKHPKTGKEIIPSIDIIKKVADALGRDFDEVFTSIDSTTKIILNSSNILSTTATNIISMPETKKVPLLGTIACGEPILAVENVADYIDMDTETHADFALRCKGDSMINARIFDGDVVYIRKQSTVENGEIAAVIINGMESEATLKRVYTSEDSIRLCAANPMYPDKVFEKEKMNDVTIIGKAVAFLSSIK